MTYKKDRKAGENESGESIETSNRSVSLGLDLANIFSFRIQYRSKKEEHFISIKPGESILVSTDKGYIIFRYDNDAGKAIYGFIDKNGKLRELGEI